MSDHYYQIVPTNYTGVASVFTYHGPAGLAPGTIVEIPFGRRQLIGVVKQITTKPDFATKSVGTALDVPVLPTYLQELATWMSTYYATSLTTVWNTFLPTGLSKHRRATVEITPSSSTGLPAFALTPDQRHALTVLADPKLDRILLEGVTGSGKTRVYLELAAKCLDANRSAIILVPEITLTPQIVRQFETTFGSGVVLASHSKMTEANRHSIWKQAITATVAKQPKIIIGPRSCLFLPAWQIGLIVVDECHESSYKQDRQPRYHTLAVATYLARLCTARLVLGSATPGINEQYLTTQGRFKTVFLPTRANNLPLPKSTIIDLRNKDLFKQSKIISEPLITGITDALNQKRQALLYLNRRGSASAQVCDDCGYVSTCPNCQLPVTFHADSLRLICHHCNWRQAVPAICAQCTSPNLKLLGVGTKRVEAEILRLFPEARIARLDRDSATLKHLKDTLKKLDRGLLDIVIGTQMIAKGLDLPAVDVVGVISADTLLFLPDFTATERTFQLLNQVAGRAGRGDRPGHVYVQTYSPTHPAITTAASHNYHEFVATELAERSALRYPPFTYLLHLETNQTSSVAAQRQATELAQQLRRVRGLEIIGPAPAFLETIANHYRWTITVKSPRRPPLVEIAQQLAGTSWIVDLDPINLL